MTLYPMDTQTFRKSSSAKIFTAPSFMGGNTEI